MTYMMHTRYFVKTALVFLLALVCACAVPGKGIVLLGTAARSALVPPSQTVAGWFFDATNTSGCASDNNNCTQSTCGAAGSFQGPCITYAEVVSRWTTYAPHTRQATTLTIMGPMPSTDTFYVDPMVEGAGNYMAVMCSLGPSNQAWTTTLGTVTSKAKTPAPGTLLQAVIAPSSGTVAARQLVVNGTHPSFAMAASNSGTTWSLTQPVTGCSSPSVGCAPVEVDTWALGDVVTGFTLSTVFVAEALPSTTAFGDYAGSGRGSVFFHGCDLETTGAMVMNQFVIVSDSVLRPGVQSSPQAGSSGGNEGPFLVGTYLGQFRGAGMSIFGGITTSGFSWATGSNLDGDVWLGQALNLQGGTNRIGSLYIGVALNIFGGMTQLQTSLWGPHPPLIQGGGFLSYPSGAGGAAASLLFANQMLLNGSSTACSTTGGATPTIVCGKALTPANLDLAVGSGGFGGNAFQLGGGQLINVSQGF